MAPIPSLEATQREKLVLMNVDWLFINKAISDSTDAEIGCFY